jgi:hypothetical protein
MLELSSHRRFSTAPSTPFGRARQAIPSGTHVTASRNKAPLHRARRRPPLGETPKPRRVRGDRGTEEWTPTVRRRSRVPETRETFSHLSDTRGTAGFVLYGTSRDRCRRGRSPRGPSLARLQTPAGRPSGGKPPNDGLQAQGSPREPSAPSSAPAHERGAQSELRPCPRARLHRAQRRTRRQSTRPRRAPSRRLASSGRAPLGNHLRRTIGSWTE